MADVAASVLARLKKIAKESGRSYQLCLQLFCQEEFLRRLEKSKYAENLAKPFAAAIEGIEYTVVWSAAKGEWQESLPENCK